MLYYPVNLETFYWLAVLFPILGFSTVIPSVYHGYARRVASRNYRLRKQRVRGNVETCGTSVRRLT